MTETMVGIRLDLGADSDAEELTSVARRLRDELRQLDFETVPMPTVPPPPGAKGPVMDVLGEVWVSVAGSAGVAGLLDVLAAWITRGRGRSIKLELNGQVIDATGLSRRDQRRLIEEWIARQREIEP
ncbi:effector-associated constant component EACC1 [Acrocarpospora macrocephala]|nr:hypothetical protein [Acrocarpospora macrocephala]